MEEEYSELQAAITLALAFIFLIIFIPVGLLWRIGQIIFDRISPFTPIVKNKLHRDIDLAR